MLINWQLGCDWGRELSNQSHQWKNNSRFTNNIHQRDTLPDINYLPKCLWRGWRHSLRRNIGRKQVCLFNKHIGQCRHTKRVSKRCNSTGILGRLLPHHIHRGCCIRFICNLGRKNGHRRLNGNPRELNNKLSCIIGFLGRKGSF